MSRRLLDPKVKGEFPFRYVKSEHTDLRQTFQRIREEQKAQETERSEKVKPMRRK